MKKCFTLFIFLFAFVTSFYSYEFKLYGTNYTIDCSSRIYKEDYIEQNKFISLISEYENNNNYHDNKILFSIFNGNHYLSYDLTSTVFENIYFTIGFDSICFWAENNYVNMLYKRSDDCIFLIEFDFKNLTVRKQKLGFLSYVFDSLNQYWYDDFGLSKDFIISYFTENKLKLNKQKPFYLTDTINCDYSANSNNDFYSEITVAPDKTYIMILNDNKIFFQKIPKSAEKGLPSIIKRLIINKIQYNSKTNLKEESVIYEAQNMSIFSDLPWCPTIPYNQEEIVIQSNNETIEGLYIGNGYYNANKTYLYKQNCRAKEIEIEFIGTGMKQTVCLEDSGYLQFIPLINVNSKK